MDKKKMFNFKDSIAEALLDKQLRGNLLFATDSLIAKREGVFSDPEDTMALRRTGNALKQRVLSRLPDLLEKLEEKCRDNGMTVHWAETPEEAGEKLVERLIGDKVI